MLSRGFLVVMALMFLSIGPTPAVAGCTTCVGIDGVAYCISGNIAELCQTEDDACLFSGHRNCGGSGCFLASTMIMTAQGQIAVAQLKPGDKVISETSSGEIVSDTVVRCYATVAHHGYYLINKDLGVTSDHPFLVDSEWVLAEDLRLGDQLKSPTGNAILVKSLDYVDRGVRVYNIDTEKTSTFFADGILVHNKDPNPQG